MSITNHRCFDHPHTTLLCPNRCVGAPFLIVVGNRKKINKRNHFWQVVVQILFSSSAFRQAKEKGGRILSLCFPFQWNEFNLIAHLRSHGMQRDMMLSYWKYWTAKMIIIPFYDSIWKGWYFRPKLGPKFEQMKWDSPVPVENLINEAHISNLI